MNPHDDHRERDRGVARRPRMGRAVAPAVVLLVVCGARADEPVPPADVVREHGVTIEPPVAIGAKTASGAESPQPQSRQNGSAGFTTPRVRRTSVDHRIAGGGQAYGLETMPVGGGSSPWYRSAIGSLAVVLGLVAAAYWLVRRFVPTARASESGLLRVVSRAALSPKHSVALVHLGRRFVVVGVSPDRLDALCEIHDGDEVAELAARTATGTTRRRDAFDKALIREAHRFRDEDTAAREEPVRTGRQAGTAREPLADLLNRLRTLRSQ